MSFPRRAGKTMESPFSESESKYLVAISKAESSHLDQIGVSLPQEIRSNLLNTGTDAGATRNKNEQSIDFNPLFQIFNFFFHLISIFFFSFAHSLLVLIARSSGYEKVVDAVDCLDCHFRCFTT